MSADDGLPSCARVTGISSRQSPTPVATAAAALIACAAPVRCVGLMGSVVLLFALVRHRLLPADTHDRDGNAVTSLLHAFLAGVAATWLVWNEWRLYDEHFLLGAGSANARTVLVFSAGYMIYDMLDMWRIGMAHSAPHLMLHHATIVLCFLTAVGHGVGVPLLVATLLAEVNGMFLQLRLLSRGRALQLRQAVWLGLWLTMPAARFLPHGAIQYAVWRCWRNFAAPWMACMAFAGMGAINVLNVKLTYDLARACRREWRREPKSED
eukprot:g78963.t1